MVYLLLFVVLPVLFKMFVLFNQDKKFISYSEEPLDVPNSGIFNLKIPDDKQDITKWEWVGDMFNGKMVKRKDCNF